MDDNICIKRVTEDNFQQIPHGSIIMWFKFDKEPVKTYVLDKCEKEGKIIRMWFTTGTWLSPLEEILYYVEDNKMNKQKSTSIKFISVEFIRMQCIDTGKHCNATSPVTQCRISGEGYQIVLGNSMLSRNDKNDGFAACRSAFLYALDNVDLPKELLAKIRKEVFIALTNNKHVFNMQGEDWTAPVPIFIRLNDESIH